MHCGIIAGHQENLRSEFKKQTSIILNSPKPKQEKTTLNGVMKVITTLMNFQSYLTALNRKGHQADVSFTDGQKQPMPTNPATQRPATPPPIPAHQPPPVPPERTTSKSSPTDAKPVPAPRSAHPPAVSPRTGATAKPSPTDAKPTQAKQSPPLLPPRTGATAKPSPTDAQVKSSTPFLEEAGRTDAKPKKPFVPPPGAVKVM
jgi:hypothetical protein